MLQKFGTVEGIYQAIESTPEEEFKELLKNELGISRSPVPNLTKKTNQELAVQARQLLGGILDKKVAKEVIKILKTPDNKEFKEAVKVLDEKDLDNFKTHAFRLISDLEDIETGLVGKKAALLSKQLATIKTDIEEYNKVSLDDIVVNLNPEKNKSGIRKIGIQ